MPPKRNAVKVQREENDEQHIDAIRKAFVVGFHKAQQSTSSHATQRKVILEWLRSHLQASLSVLCAVCVKTLSIQQSPDVAKRHSFFLAEVCRSYVSDTNNDVVPLKLIEAVLPYHGAREKTVRYSVCSVIEPLLRTLKQDVDSDERSIFFDRIVEAMKLRAFDTFAPVRERAVAALATFQEGKKDCDVTQCLLAAACEDSNVSVRRQIVFGALGKEVYFGPMFRMTRDVAPIVRKTAWDSLAKAKFTHVIAFCQLLQQDFINLIHAGMNDSASFVSLSVSAAISKWLLRDMQGDAVLMLSKAPLPATETPAIVAFANALLKAVVKASDKSKGPVIFPLVVKALTPANVVMWKACCELTINSSMSAAEEAALLPSLNEFSKVLRDAIDTFILQERAECRVAVFVNIDHADFILRILLSMFPIYDQALYLNQCDDTTRASLIKNLSSLLKVVTDTEPGLYAEDTMRALRLIADRHSKEEVDATVRDVVEILFKTLALPRLYDLGYDDVEMFGRKDQERREELHTLKTTRGLSTAAEKRMEALSESIETDTLYLTRMMHVVHQYLSFCRRGDKVPQHCAHVIQLGRCQSDPHVRGLAMKALGMQCLMAPPIVHTFLPLVLADFYGTAGEVAPLQSTPVTQAALCVIFDLLTEYPATFFEAGTGLSHADATAAELAMEASTDALSAAQRVQRRAAAEAAIEADDIAKVGSARLLVAARRGLLADDSTLRRIATRGFMKLLSCGRLPPAAVEEIIGLMMVVNFTFEAAPPGRRLQKDHVVGAFVFRQLDHFLASYAGSDPRRMRQVADGGVLGARLIFTRQAQPTPQTPAVRLLRKLVMYTDAAILASVREVDPDFVAAALQEHREQDAQAEGVAVVEDEEGGKGSNAKQRGPRLSSTNSAGSNRLWAMLSRHSLHEHLAQELLLEIAHQRGNHGAQKTCADELVRLRFYGRNPQTAALIAEYGSAAVEAVTDPTVAESIADFLKAFDAVMATQPSAADVDDDSRSAVPSGRASFSLSHMQAQINRRVQTVNRILLDVGPHLIAEGTLVAARLSSGTATSGGRPSKQHRAENPSPVLDETPSEDLVTSLTRKPVSRRGGR